MNFLPEQLNAEDQLEVATSEISAMYMKVTGKNSMFFDGRLLKLSDFYPLQTGLYPSIVDIIDDLNTLIQERYNHRESCTTVIVSQRTLKVKIYLATERSGLAFLS